MSVIRFGPAGNSDSFATMGYKKTEQIAQYVNKMGLNAEDRKSVV